MRVAVIGAGIAGLGAAYWLSSRFEVDVYEREPRLGGHAHTHTLEVGARTYHLDTGFLVYNTRTYPLFTQLLSDLGVATQWSDMTFSVRCRRCTLEYGSRSLNAWFAQRRRIIDPRHWRLLAGILRLFRHGRAFLSGPDRFETTLGEFLASARLDDDVARHFILPMTGAIWSASFEDMRSFPARSILHFLDNHGLLAAAGAPRWRTIAGGSARYVDALAARVSGAIRTGAPVSSVVRHPGGVTLYLASGETVSYDKVVIAAHADQALTLLADASAAEQDLLGRFRYSTNETTLHTDSSVLPARPVAWAAWNCDVHDCHDMATPVSVSYHLNRLQSIEAPTQFCVSLNRRLTGDHVLARMTYAHPILDAAAVRAQADVTALNGTRHTYYCGAHLRFGFHEDGLVSARQVAVALGALS
ncbi:MAG: NAD(P)/FAD-dependent oxidoreductase [Vicinamibacterales bacterium]